MQTWCSSWPTSAAVHTKVPDARHLCTLQVLLTNLSSPDVHRSIKPVILGVCGDLALAVQNKFEPYMTHVLPILQSAQQLCISNQGSGKHGSANH